MAMPIPLIYMIAGEPSGDLLGARLMTALRKLSPAPLRFAGIGGPLMQDEKMQSLLPMQELAMMGFAEIFPHIPRLIKHINATVDDIIKLQPELVVTIDSPGFNFRVAKKLREKGYKGQLIHYVAPSVWAYKPERAEKMAQWYNHVLALLPFEPPYFEQVKLPCTFVGHPVTREWKTKGDASVFRIRHSILSHHSVLCMLPGSREGEINRHMPLYSATAKLLAKQQPNLTIVMPVPARFVKSLASEIKRWPLKTIVVNSEIEKRDAFAVSQVALAKSGTVSLELALAQVPMVVTYKVNPLSAWFLKKVLKTKYFSIVNIVADKEIIPERIQQNARPDILATELLTLLINESKREAQTAEAQQALDALGTFDDETPSEQAAKVVLAHLFPENAS